MLEREDDGGMKKMQPGSSEVHVFTSVRVAASLAHCHGVISKIPSLATER